MPELTITLSPKAVNQLTVDNALVLEYLGSLANILLNQVLAALEIPDPEDRERKILTSLLSDTDISAEVWFTNNTDEYRDFGVPYFSASKKQINEAELKMRDTIMSEQRLNGLSFTTTVEARDVSRVTFGFGTCGSKERG